MAIWLTASIKQHYKNENFKQSLQKIQLTASVKQYCSLSYKVIKKTHTNEDKNRWERNKVTRL